MVLEDFTQIMIYFLRSHVLLPEGNTFLVLLSALVLTLALFCNFVTKFSSVYKSAQILMGASFLVMTQSWQQSLWWHLSTCVMTVIYGSFVLLWCLWVDFFSVKVFVFFVYSSALLSRIESSGLMGKRKQSTVQTSSQAPMWLRWPATWMTPRTS